MGPRAGLSSVLLVGAAVLLLAIAVGNSMGNHVLGQIPSRAPAFSTTPIPTPSATADDDPAAHVLARRRQVLSVATDPAFPDPRVTPEPTVPPTPKPTPKPTPSPSPPATATPNPNYTSPPLPIPLATDAPGDASASPGENPPAGSPHPAGTGHSVAGARSYSTLPPIAEPTLNP